MNYYYNLKLNLNEKLYEFYEWKNYEIINVSKVPFFKVNKHTLKDLYLYNIKVEQDFLNKIYNKNISSENISYLAIFNDNKNSIAIEFNDKGESIYKSKLEVDADLTISELSYNMKLLDLKYTKLKKEYYLNMNLRNEEEIKNIVKRELINLKRKNNIEKLKYIYYEINNTILDNINDIYYKLSNIVKNNEINKIKDIYNIIILSYKKEH